MRRERPGAPIVIVEGAEVDHLVTGERCRGRYVRGRSPRSARRLIPAALVVATCGYVLGRVAFAIRPPRTAAPRIVA